LPGVGAAVAVAVAADATLPALPALHGLEAARVASGPGGE